MADPTVSLLASGESATASTVVSFTAVPAGTLLVLAVAADDYKTGNPSGWSVLASIEGGSFHGQESWYKIANGSETSVTYVIGSATRSAYVLLSADNVDTGTPLDGTPTTQNTNTSLDSYTTPSSSTTSGRRLALALIGGSSSLAPPASVGSWLNSFTGAGVGVTTATPGLLIGAATLAFDGGGTVSSGATFTAFWSAQARTGTTAVFRVASGGTDGTLVAPNFADAVASGGVSEMFGQTPYVPQPFTGVPRNRRRP